MISRAVAARECELKVGNAARAAVRSVVKHVFAAQKFRTYLVIRNVGIARATPKLALGNINGT